MLGAVALGMASLSGNLNDSTKRAEGLVARTEFTSSLNNYLGSQLGCDDLKGAVAGGVYSSIPRPISFTKWNYAGLSNIRGGYDANNRKLTPFKYYDLSELDGAIHTDTSPQFVTSKLPDGTPETLRKSTLIVRLSLRITGREYKHIYNIPVLSNASGVLRFCSDERNIAESCAAIQGIYDPVAKKCDLKAGCILKGTFSTLGSAVGANGSCGGYACNQRFGAPVPNQFTNDFSCPTGATAMMTHSSTWVTQENTGKKSSANVTNVMTWYNCMICP